MGVFSRLLEAIDAESVAALVTVLAVEGSGPREPGARMVVRPSGGFHGTIGGGMLEWEALADARRALAPGRGPAIRETKSLGPDLGQCCGGRVRLMIETFDARDRAQLAVLGELEAKGDFESEAATAADGRLERRPIVASGHVPRPRPDAAKVSLLPDGRIIEHFGEERTPLLLFGAGHVGRALVLALAPLPFGVRWIDSRGAFPAAAPVNVTMVHAPSPVAELDGAPAGAFVLVMTHSHPLDLDIVTQALRGGRFDYIGLIGSATKRARFASRMHAAGLARHEIGRLVCPIGLPEIGGKEPAVIAASVAADLLTRRGRLAASDASREPQRVRA